jgi:hypothetical protein
MSLTNDGFFAKNVIDRIAEIAARLKEYIPQVDMNEGEWLFQVVKLAGMREEEMQIEMQRLVDNLSIPLAYGEYLEMQGANFGAYKKTGTKASGSLVGASDPDGTIIPSGSYFTIDGKTYFSTEDAVFPSEIPMTRGSGSSDTIPQPYLISSIESITPQTGGVGTAFTGYTLADNVITWDGSAGNPSQGQAFFVKAGGTIETIFPVTALEPGFDGNMSIGIVAESQDFSLIDFETYTEINGGEDLESDVKFRRRVLSARNRARSVNSLKTLLENLDGVKEVQIQEILGTDWAVPLTWDDANEPTGSWVELKLSNWNEVFQEFTPGNGIASIRGVDLRVAKPSVDYVGSFKVSLLDSLDTEVSSLEITQDDLDYTKGTETQTVFVALKHGPIFNTTGYRIKVSQSESSTWQLGYVKDEGNPGDLNILPTATAPSGTLDLTGRTRWLANYYKVNLLQEDGYSFQDVADTIDEILDMNGDGFGVLGVEHDIQEIGKDYIQVEAVIYTRSGYIFEGVAADVDNSIRDYLAELTIGESIPYLGIVGAIMGTPGVANMQSMKIRKNTTEVSAFDNQANIYIGDGRKAIPGTPLTVITHGNP